MPQPTYPTAPYHCRILLKHFAQKLHELGAPTAAPIALLAWAWAAASPYAAEPVVCVDAADVIPESSERSRRRWLAQLTEIGAVQRERFGLRLMRPNVAVLVPQVRGYLTEAWAFAPAAPGTAPLPDSSASKASTTPSKISREAAIADRQAAKLKRQQQAEYLAGFKKSRSDVRDILAKLGRFRNPNTLSYSGNGSAPVAAAVTWMHETESTWVAFVSACKACSRDASPDKPERPHELFYDKHRDYLTRLCAELSAAAAAKEAP